VTGRRTRRSSGFPCCLSLQIALFGQAGKYLARKIESFANDIRVLLKAANSPQCRRLFTYGFNVRALPIVNSQTASVPATSEQWETVLEKALLFRNSVKGRMEGDFLINTKRVMEDTAYMAKEVISQSLVVHCEVKLLTHIFETETIGIPKTYTYIGVSKLSCRGCQAFFESFNDVHGTSFTTKGSHSKSYWPWQFPQQSFAKRDEVLSQTYWLLAKCWVESYNGYTAKRVSFAPQSSSGSSTGFGDGNDKAKASVDKERVDKARAILYSIKAAVVD